MKKSFITSGPGRTSCADPENTVRGEVVLSFYFLLFYFFYLVVLRLAPVLKTIFLINVSYLILVASLTPRAIRVRLATSL